MKKMLVLVLFCLSIIASTAYANSIKLYEKPNDSAKVVTSLQAGTQLLPIYYPKQGNWIKVANPKNGDVGWVKISDLNGETTANGVVETQKVMVQPGKGYQIYREEQANAADPNAPQAIDPEKVQLMMNQMQQKATQMQQSMQEVLNNMVQQIDTMQKALGNESANGQTMQPMIVVPDNGQ